MYHVGVSREHCQLTYQQGSVLLEDLGSRNGTFLNGKPLMKPTELKHQDYIQIDDVLLIYSSRSQDADVDAIAESRERSADMGDSRSLSFVKEVTDRLHANIAKVIQGKDDVIRHVLIALLSDGHVLLDVVGLEAAIETFAFNDHLPVGVLVTAIAEDLVSLVGIERIHGLLGVRTIIVEVVSTLQEDLQTLDKRRIIVNIQRIGEGTAALVRIIQVVIHHRDRVLGR